MEFCMDRGRKLVLLSAMTVIGLVVSAKDRIVVVPAHPDDLIPCFGTCLLSKDIFEWHVIEFTHGERGLGPVAFKDGSCKKIRMEEEGNVCRELGATLHWLDEIDGEAYACRETCERLAALLKELKPRAVFAHWPVDIHGDHAMAGVAVQKALFLAGLSPELYFIEQEYQAKRFVPDQFVDISDVMERKCELIRMYKCQYRDGSIEKRKCAIAKVNGMHSMLLAGGSAEGFMSFVQPLQGQGKTIFQELPPPKRRCGLRFQGARP
jgi:LmbE family N-acetylglucosaminyl deacetylase